MRSTIPAIFCIAAGTFGYSAVGDHAAARASVFHSGAVSSRGRVDSTSPWIFTEEQRYGGEDGSGAELVEPGTMGVDAAGRLYVADSKPVVIKVYNPSGTLLRTIGRQGGGPGEFRGAWIAVRGAHLIVHDPGQSRTTVFDRSGTYLRS